MWPARNCHPIDLALARFARRHSGRLPRHLLYSFRGTEINVRKSKFERNPRCVHYDYHVDRSLYPRAYGIVANENLMYPVDMSDWPVKIDRSRQLFVDDYLIATASNIQRQVHQPTKHRRNHKAKHRKDEKL